MSLLLIKLGAYFIKLLLKLLRCRFDCFGIAAFKSLLHLVNLCLNSRFFGFVNLAFKLAERLFTLIYKLVGIVSYFNFFLALLILFGILLGLLDSLVNILLAEV